MTVTVMKTFFEKLQLRAFNYRDCKYFESDRFRTDVLSEYNFLDAYKRILDITRKG